MDLPAGTYSFSYSRDMAIVRTRSQWGMAILFMIVLLSLPLFAGSYFLNLIIMIAINAVAVHGLSLLTGYCGQISIGHAAFVAIGAYTSAILVTNLGLPFWIALPLAGLVTGLVGMIFGLLSLRVKGFYLVMATLAAQFIVHFILMLDPFGLTGGTFGVTAPAPKLGGIVFNSAQSFYYIAIGACILATFFAKNLARMDVGRAFTAIRDNDIAAEVMGINLYRNKLLAFFLGCYFAGIAGSLFVHYMGTVSPDRFTLLQSIWFLGMLIIGGLGSTSGVIFGVAFVQLLEELTVILSTSLGQAFPMLAMQAAAFCQIIFGLVVVLFLVFEPRGLAHRWQLLKASYRLWPFSY